MFWAVFETDYCVGHLITFIQDTCRLLCTVSDVIFRGWIHLLRAVEPMYDGREKELMEIVWLTETREISVLTMYAHTKSTVFVTSYRAVWNSVELAMIKGHGLILSARSFPSRMIYSLLTVCSSLFLPFHKSLWWSCAGLDFFASIDTYVTILDSWIGITFPADSRV